jgi:flagellar basal body-associated protein FliL
MRFLSLLMLGLLLAFAGLARADDAPGQKAPEHRITQSPSYLMVDPLYETIIDDDKPCGLLMVGIGLDVPDPALRAEVTRTMPVLRDAYVRNMMNFSTTSVHPWEQPDVEAIADRLQRVTDRALRRKGAKVLLAQVALRLTK